jgi:porphobilinogen synthase
MIEAAARLGWIDGPRAHEEALTAIRRAGADRVISYWSRQFARARRGM